MTITTFRKAQNLLSYDSEIEAAMTALSGGRLIIYGRVRDEEGDEHEGFQKLDIPLSRGELTKLHNTIFSKMRSERKKIKNQLLEL
jgi:transcription initiation factor IIE alpha subunit